MVASKILTVSTLYYNTYCIASVFDIHQDVVCPAGGAHVPIPVTVLLQGAEFCILIGTPVQVIGYFYKLGNSS